MPRSRTYFERWLRTVGVRKSHRVMGFVAQWALFCRDEGRAPRNMEEYADWWGVSRATAYREQQAWREAMPEYATPSEWFEALGVDPVQDIGPTTGLAMRTVEA